MIETTTLRQVREDRGITLGELGAVTGLSVPMLSRVERGERQLSALACIRVARALAIGVGELFPRQNARARGRKVAR